LSWLADGLGRGSVRRYRGRDHRSDPEQELDMPDDQPESWRTIVYGTPLLAAGSERAGEVREVLGSDADDIFHGLRVRLATGGRDVMIAADDVDAMAADGIRTSLTLAEIEAAPPYDETATYHLASVGWRHKHLGWQRDSKHDGEPG
jgi:hypothetical protein